MMTKRISTKQLAELLSDNTTLDRKGAEKFIDTLSSFIIKGIEKKQPVKILGFGTFKVVVVKERESVHIQTGERFTIPSHHKLSFIPDSVFKNHINRPFSYFEPIETIDENRQTVKVIDRGEVIEALEITDEMLASGQVAISEDVVGIEVITNEVITEEHVETVAVGGEVETEAEAEVEAEEVIAGEHIETQVETAVVGEEEVETEVEVEAEEVITEEHIETQVETVVVEEKEVEAETETEVEAEEVITEENIETQVKTVVVEEEEAEVEIEADPDPDSDPDSDDAIEDEDEEIDVDVDIDVDEEEIDDEVENDEIEDEVEEIEEIEEVEDEVVEAEAPIEVEDKVVEAKAKAGTEIKELIQLIRLKQKPKAKAGSEDEVKIETPIEAKDEVHIPIEAESKAKIESEDEVPIEIESESETADESAAADESESEDIDKFIDSSESTSVNLPVEKQIKKPIPTWVQFVLYPLLFVLAVGVGTFAFLRFNAANQQSQQGKDQSYVNTDGQNYTEPLPIGAVQPVNVSQSDEGSPINGIDGNQAAGATVEHEETSSDIQAPTPDGSTNTGEVATNTEALDEKKEINWLAEPSQSSQSSQTRRADKPKSDTESKNSSRTDSRSSTPTDQKPAESQQQLKSLPARVSMTQGLTLTQLAQEYYGDKIFWVYIYEHNRSRIKDFERIQVGTEIILPEAKTYGIDAKSKASTDKALLRQRSLMQQKN